MDEAVGVLLCGREDAEIQDYFIRTAFPPREQAEHVVRFLEEQGSPTRTADIEREVNVRRPRVEAMLKVLEVEGAVERVDSRWQRTLQPWAYDAERVARVTAQRRAEQAAMADYARTSECRMAFLRRQLDDPTAAPCSRCDACVGPPVTVDVGPELVAAAVGHLRHAALELEPRQRWPAGLEEPRGRIGPDRQLRPGRVLSMYGDAGWGRVVKECKYGPDRYPDDLVDAAVALVERWAPEPRPQWVTWVPSSTTAGLLPDFAQRLAAALKLDVVEAVRRVRPGRPQKEMENSVHQLLNVFGAFEVANPVPTTSMLLVDDIVDSRWTLTVIGAALREAGTGPVHPFVLAKAVSR